MATRYLQNGYMDRIDLSKIRFSLEKLRWEGITGFYHPDDLNSTVPISCMKTNPNIMTAVAMVCKPNQAFLDEQERLGIKTTFDPDIFTKKPVVEITDNNGDIIQVPIGDKENLAPLVMLAGLAALLFMGG